MPGVLRPADLMGLGAGGGTDGIPLRLLGASGTYVWDDGVGTDNASINSRAPDLVRQTTGFNSGLWNVDGRSGATTPIIRSNRFTATGHITTVQTQSIGVVETNHADCVLRMTVRLGSSDLEYYLAGAVFRYTDANNLWEVQLIRNGTVAVNQSLRLLGIVSNVVTVYSPQGSGTDFALDTDYALTVTLSGSSISATCGSLTTSTTSSQFSTNTVHGFWIGHTTGVDGVGTDTAVDDFKASLA